MQRIGPGLIVMSLVVLFIGGCQHETATTPATLAASNNQPPATHLTPVRQASLSSGHMLIISGESIARPPGGNSAIIYVIDEDREALSMLAFDMNHIDFYRGAMRLERIFMAPLHTSADDNIRVAGAVTGIKYTAFTSRLPDGGEGLYVTDHHGVIALFTFDSANKRIQLLDVNSLKEAFK